MFFRSLRQRFAQLRSHETARQVREVLLGGPSATALWRRNRTSSEPVTGDAAVVVSLATHGARFASAHYTVEAIGRGTVRPRRLVLWVDDARLLENLSPALERLRRRGLELRHGDARYGPHNKYFPQISSGRDADLPLVIADDDALYGEDWLAELLATVANHPGAMIANRAHRIELDGETIAPYAQWSGELPGQESARTMPTGRSGVLYPPSLQAALREAGEGFLDSAPRADDIWVHAVALRAGIPVTLTPRAPRNFRMAPVRDLLGLSAENVFGGGNDAQIRATYSPTDIAKLVAGGIAEEESTGGSADRLPRGRSGRRPGRRPRLS